MIKQVATQAVRGFVMGAADVVPGVSGGTVALVLGIYERLIDNVYAGARVLGHLVRLDVDAALKQLKSVEWAFLLPLLGGILVAVAALSGVIESALKDHPEAMAGLFFGLVVASIVVAWKLIKQPAATHGGIALASGAVLFVLLGYQSGPAVDPSLLAYLGAGAVAICAMILPGISGSFILLMLGMYAAVIGAVHDRAFLEIGVFGTGAVVGLAAFSTVLRRVLDHAHDIVMAGLIGLMLGSLRVLWPWPHGVGIISDVKEEAISGTGLDWPASDNWLWPLLLAVGSAVAVLAFAQIAERLTPKVDSLPPTPSQADRLPG